VGVLVVVQVIGLGRGKEDAVDAAAKRLARKAFRPGRKAPRIDAMACRRSSSAGGPAWIAPSASTSTICRSIRAKWARKKGLTTSRL
jgi:hypothetical protein